MSARVVEDMPFEDYLAHPALSASGMKRLLDSPARFQWERENPYETPALILGRLIHAFAFHQPHNFIIKDWDARTTAGKARRDEVLAEKGVESVDDLALVSEDDWAIAGGIAEALRVNKLAHSILYPPGVRHEVSAFWTDDDTGIELKCRFDAISDRAIGDLKSTHYAHPNSSAKTAATYGYFTSAAQYRAGALATGLGHRDFILVNVEKAPPHFISVTGVNEYDLELAERLRRKAIRIYADCSESGEWPDYTQQIEYPDAPGWWRVMAENDTGLYEIEVASA